MEVAWPDRRGDVLAGLEVLATDAPELIHAGHDPRWPDLTNAVHWVVDDTFWDREDPAGHIGLILRDDREADALRLVVAAVVAVSKRQGAQASDARWFGDPQWPEVRRLAAEAIRLLSLE